MVKAESRASVREKKKRISLKSDRLSPSKFLSLFVLYVTKRKKEEKKTKIPGMRREYLAVIPFSLSVSAASPHPALSGPSDCNSDICGGRGKPWGMTQNQDRDQDLDNYY